MQELIISKKMSDLIIVILILGTGFGALLVIYVRKFFFGNEGIMKDKREFKDITE